jgi:hypothetical protein
MARLLQPGLSLTNDSGSKRSLMTSGSEPSAHNGLPWPALYWTGGSSPLKRNQPRGGACQFWAFAPNLVEGIARDRADGKAFAPKG